MAIVSPHLWVLLGRPFHWSIHFRRRNAQGCRLMSKQIYKNGMLVLHRHRNQTSKCPSSSLRCVENQWPTHLSIKPLPTQTNSLSPLGVSNWLKEVVVWFTYRFWYDALLQIIIIRALARCMSGSVRYGPLLHCLLGWQRQVHNINFLFSNPLFYVYITQLYHHI